MIWSIGQDVGDGNFWGSSCWAVLDGLELDGHVPGRAELQALPQFGNTP